MQALGEYFDPVCIAMANCFCIINNGNELIMLALVPYREIGLQTETEIYPIDSHSPWVRIRV